MRHREWQQVRPNGHSSALPRPATDRGRHSHACGLWRPLYSAESGTEFAEDSSLEGSGFEPSYGSRLGYNTELFPTQIRGTAVGAAFTFGSAGGALAPAIVGWIATSHSIATALPLLAVSFFLIAPMFLFVARETTRKELTDFVGQETRP